MPFPTAPKQFTDLRGRRGPHAADRAIEELVAADEDPARLRVVTSDRPLTAKVTALGAKAVSAGTFRAELEG